MERLTNKDLKPILKYEKLINIIYNSYKPLETYIAHKTRKSYKNLNISELRKKFNFKELYENNIKLFEFINQLNLRMFDYFDSNVREEVKNKYGEVAHDILDKALSSWVRIGTIIKISTNDYKDYFSLNYDKTTGKFVLNNLPDGEQVDISKYAFKQDGTLKEPKDIYNELKKDYNLVEFDLNLLKEPYRKIVSTVLADYTKNPKVLSNVEINQIPVDTSNDWLLHQYSQKEKIELGEEIHILLGGNKIVIPLPGEFNSIDSFNYYKIASNQDLVDNIFGNHSMEDIYDEYGDVEQEIVDRYLSDDGEYKMITLKTPIIYSFKDNIVEINRLMYYKNDNVDIKPRCETSSEMILSDFN